MPSFRERSLGRTKQEVRRGLSMGGGRGISYIMQAEGIVLWMVKAYLQDQCG